MTADPDHLVATAIVAASLAIVSFVALFVPTLWARWIDALARCWPAWWGVR